MKFTGFKKIFRFRKRLMIAAGFCLIAGVLFLWGADRAVAAARGRIFSAPELIPPRDVALVLGTSKQAKYGPNLYFRYRMDAAARLYHAGKVRKLIVSGDNRRRDYNEPEDMRAALIECGVAPEDIYADYAGLRTLDSVIRAKKIFGQTRITVVSQKDHCERALYIARNHGIDAVGFAARDVSLRRFRLKQRWREAFARVLAVVDVKLLHRAPRHLGPPVPIEFQE